MARQEEFKKLVEEWLELDLPFTCTSLDTYTSIRIERRNDTVVFVNKHAGKTGELGIVQVADGKVTGMVYVSSTPQLGLMLFGLEKAIEEN